MRHRSAEWFACIMLMPGIALAQQGAAGTDAPPPSTGASDTGATSAPLAAPRGHDGRAAQDRDAEPAVDTSRGPEGPSVDQPRPSAVSPSAAPEPASAQGTSKGKGKSREADGKPRTADAGHESGAKSASGKAMDHLQLGTTDITGNRELPKVMYIVPWKSSNLGDLTGKPLNSLVDEALQPVDRDVFRRENRYYRAVTQGAAHDAPRDADRSPAGGGAPGVGDER